VDSRDLFRIKPVHGEAIRAEKKPRHVSAGAFLNTKIVFETSVSSGFGRSFAFFPGYDDVASCFVTEGFDGGLLVEFFGTVCYDCYLLGSCFLTILDSD
jgi:hypothetical protein